jgi:N-acetylneuraminate lyase
MTTDSVPPIRFHGLVAAALTPMHDDGSVNLDRIPDVVAFLHQEGLDALYVLGSSGEGVSLATSERKLVAEEYLRAAEGKLPVIVQVGHNSLAEAQELAEHSAATGAAAISANSPSYFKPATVADLVSCMAEVAGAAPDCPFYYYHIPAMTGVDLSMPRFLELSAEAIPSLAGIKYSSLNTDQMMLCLDCCDQRYNLLFGSDEHLINGLVCGAHGAVGSTYNWAAPLYRRILKSMDTGDLEAARHDQLLSVRMIEIMRDYPFVDCFKTMMRFAGVDCGSSRMPNRRLTPDQRNELKVRLDGIGFFTWGRH